VPNYKATGALKIEYYQYPS